ncbi:MAG TPA: hypothetical protein PK263_00805 [bacterium]|nr:hypothetical protein [bacterium]
MINGVHEAPFDISESGKPKIIFECQVKYGNLTEHIIHRGHYVLAGYGSIIIPKNLEEVEAVNKAKVFSRDLQLAMDGAKITDTEIERFKCFFDNPDMTEPEMDWAQNFLDTKVQHVYNQLREKYDEVYLRK